MSTTRDSTVESLRAHLGDERFRRFVGQVNALAGSERLHFWHYEVLEEVERKHALSLPRSADALVALLAGSIPDPPRLAETATPDWAHVEFLGTQCPVQAEGWCDVVGSKEYPASVVWRFFFRARGEQWSIAASDEEDPVDVCSDGEHSFYYEELYEARAGEYDAGYMPEDIARAYIIRELDRLRLQRQVR